MAGKSNKGRDAGLQIVCRNARATFDFTIEDKLEAGLVLMGSEVKSLRARRADLDGAYASVDHGELLLHKLHIAPYEQAGVFGHETRRTRKLLAHKQEIQKLASKLALRGCTLVPLAVYFKDGRAKIELGLGWPKHKEDRRQDMKKKAADRETRAAMSAKRR
jgi:SsrA-binding protein